MKDNMWAIYAWGIGCVLLIVCIIAIAFIKHLSGTLQSEKSLPRDQKCIIVAVPENKHEKD